MVDALASGASVLMDVEVRVLFWAPLSRYNYLILLLNLTLGSTFMGYILDTSQLPSSIPHTVIRGRTYYFQMRVPKQHLVYNYIRKD
jgi:hypothetical protein